MKYYPIHLSIRRKVCVVIGGGKVAERKVRNILRCGGIVKVISPKLTKTLSRMAVQRKIEYRRGEYQTNDIRGAFLAYAATSERKVNAKVAKDAQQMNILVNVCDSPEESTFILPALLRTGGMTFSICSDGVSPKNSVFLRNRLRDLIRQGILTLGKGGDLHGPKRDRKGLSGRSGPR